MKRSILVASVAPGALAIIGCGGSTGSQPGHTYFVAGTVYFDVADPAATADLKTTYRGMQVSSIPATAQFRVPTRPNRQSLERRNRPLQVRGKRRLRWLQLESQGSPAQQ